MGDDRGDVKPGFNHAGHFVPGFVHFTSVNPFESQPVEYDFVPVDNRFRPLDSKQGDFPAVAHIVNHAV